MVSKTQLEIMIDANEKLIMLYFNIGKILEENSKWGNKFIDSIAIEFKIVEFKPEFAGKMSFYLTALDEKLKTETDNASIGIILCQTKNNKVVDYSLKYINRPIGVSEYKIFNKSIKDILEKLK